MGLRFRKSINLGLGFRINLSKTGIGYSWGFPGYRVTKMANGRNRTTYSIPGTGISYVDESSNRQNGNVGLLTGEVENFENIPIEDIEKKDPILEKINRTVMLNRFANIFMWSILLVPFISTLGFILFFVGIGLKIWVATKMKIQLYYEFDDETRKMYDSLKEVLILLSNSKKIWQISSSTRVYNAKYNAGAGNTIERNNAFVTNKLPWFIKSNIDIYGLNLKNQKMFFTPDRVIIFKGFGNVFGCAYNDMFLGINSTRFVESERVYSDSEIVDYTWYYANKNGDRDLRFANNKKYPVCKYGELTFKSPHGINTIINFSNESLSDEIQKNLISFGNVFNKILARTKNKTSNDKSDTVEKEEKKVIKSIDELIEKKEFKENVKEIEPYKYVLPNISLLENDESKSLVPYIEKTKNKKEIMIPLGEYKNELIIESINSMPNLLIGGTVMSGKTSFINTIITSILLTKTPKEVRFVIFDSKRVDYAQYNAIPHLLLPVISDAGKFAIVLKRMSAEIERRMELLIETNNKSIDLYNQRVDVDKRLANIIVIIDDFTTLNQTDAINESIEFITSNGWNVGVFVILAANHPSAKVVPTVSKSNFPARLSFRVASSTASQIIIDESGAEKLTGYDVLYKSRMNDKTLKLKIPYVSDEDINTVIDYVSKQRNSSIENDFLKTKPTKSSTDYDDPMYNDVVEFAVMTGKISASLIQRKFRFGYERAARMIDLLEERGIIGPQNGSKPREVLVKLENEDGE